MKVPESLLTKALVKGYLDQSGDAGYYGLSRIISRTFYSNNKVKVKRIARKIPLYATENLTK
jgi:hypothetical protein